MIPFKVHPDAVLLMSIAGLTMLDQIEHFDHNAGFVFANVFQKG